METNNAPGRTDTNMNPEVPVNPEVPATQEVGNEVDSNEVSEVDSNEGMTEAEEGAIDTETNEYGDTNEYEDTNMEQNDMEQNDMDQEQANGISPETTSLKDSLQRARDALTSATEAIANAESALSSLASSESSDNVEVQQLKQDNETKTAIIDEFKSVLSKINELQTGGRRRTHNNRIIKRSTRARHARRTYKPVYGSRFTRKFRF